MKKRVTINLYGEFALQDYLGLEASSLDAPFVSSGGKSGQTVTFDVNGTAWTQIRKQLISASQIRIPATDANGVPLGTGEQMPLLTYTVIDVPGDKPRLHQIEGGLNVGAGGAATQTLTLRGENLIAGLAAELVVSTVQAQPLVVYPGTAAYRAALPVLRLVAVEKGPVGNRLALIIEAASGAGSVTVTPGTAASPTLITVVPAANASNSTAIAAQINGDAVASTLVTATALVASSPMGPSGSRLTGLGASAASGPSFLPLTGGDGGGVAATNLLVAPTSLANRLRLVADKAGNQGNLITITILVSQGADAVNVSGNDITVTRTAATTAIGTLASAINGNAAAAALVTATAIGSGSLGAVSKRWLSGGSGETPTVKVGGASAVVRDHSDTAMTVDVLKADAISAGAANAEQAMVSVRLNYGLLSGQITVTSS